MIKIIKKFIGVNTNKKYYSIISFNTQKGDGFIEYTHTKKIETKTEYDKLREHIKEHVDYKVENIVISNILYLLNK